MITQPALRPEGPERFVVALDGPASSGKSTVGGAAAAYLGFRFCDTGLLYRALTWLALERGLALNDGEGIAPLACEVQLDADTLGRMRHVIVDGRDVTDEVRMPRVDRAVSEVSAHAAVRNALLLRQRELATGRIIMAGRDIGTVVLPDADLKLFLDASPRERAARRALERGIEPESPEAQAILHDLERRDQVDSTRAVSPLRAAPDAVHVHSDSLPLEETIEIVTAAIARALAARAQTAATPTAANEREVRP